MDKNEKVKREENILKNERGENEKVFVMKKITISFKSISF